MPTLTECSNQIGELVKEKGFQTDLLFFKLVWGQIELAEAMDLIKKNGLPTLEETNINDIEFIKATNHYHDTVSKLGEEIVDVVFYMCDAYRLLKRRYPWLVSMDEMFDHKMHKNLNRPPRYGQQWIKDFMKVAIDHMSEEGVLGEFLSDILEYTSDKPLSVPSR